MVAFNRGGVPHVYRADVTTGGVYHNFKLWSKYLVIRVTDNPCRVFFTEADFTAGKNYIEIPIPSASTPNGEWSGPLETEGVWLRGVGGTAKVELVAMQRRG